MNTRSTVWAIFLLWVGSSADPANAQFVRGSVIEAPSGAPISGAAVLLLDERDRGILEVLSDDQGQFVLSLPSPGTYRLSVTRIGYNPARSGLFEAASANAPAVEVSLTVKPVALDSLEILSTPRVPRLERLGFYKRKEIGWGYFINREEIRERHPTWVTDLIRGLPGVRIAYDELGVPKGAYLRNCLLSVVLDGVPVTVDPNTLVHPSEIEGMEVYPSVVGVPAQYRRGLAGPCGTILIWTRR